MQSSEVWRTGRLLVRALLPLVVVTVGGFVFRLGPNYGAEVPSRPPAIAFGLAWTLLLISMGAAWAMEQQAVVAPSSSAVDIMFCLLIGSLVFYTALASKGKNVGAFWMVYVSLALALAVTGLLQRPACRALLAPLLAWLLFAGQLAQSLAND